MFEMIFSPFFSFLVLSFPGKGFLKQLGIIMLLLFLVKSKTLEMIITRKVGYSLPKLHVSLDVLVKIYG